MKPTIADRILESILGTKEWFARSKERFEEGRKKL